MYAPSTFGDTHAARTNVESRCRGNGAGRRWRGRRWKSSRVRPRLRNERKLLRVARRIGERLGLTVRTTFLGAHALPPEFEGRADAYIDAACQWLAKLHAEGLVDAVDAFCEGIGFTAAQTRRMFEAASALGLPVKLHADQLSDLGGAALVAEFGDCRGSYRCSREAVAMISRAPVHVCPGFHVLRNPLPTSLAAQPGGGQAVTRISIRHLSVAKPALARPGAPLPPYAGGGARARRACRRVAYTKGHACGRRRADPHGGYRHPSELPLDRRKRFGLLIGGCREDGVTDSDADPRRTGNEQAPKAGLF